MPMITAYDKRTGKRAQIPERWLGSRLGAGYSRTPPTAAPKTSASAAVDSKTKPPATGDTEKESDPR